MLQTALASTFSRGGGATRPRRKGVNPKGWKIPHLQVGRKRPDIAALGRSRWPKGKSANPGGVPKNGKRQHASLRYLRLQVRTGMAPLDFLFAVFRDELYDRYNPVTTTDRKITLFRKARGAKKIFVALPQRLQAAMAAAQYVHRKMPIGVESVGDRPLVLIQAEQLSTLGSGELKTLLGIVEKLGLDKVPKDITQDGELIEQDARLLENFNAQ